MIVAGRYEVGELLGAGGEARVFRARDRTIGIDVALRLSALSSAGGPLPQLPPAHANWVRLYDQGIDPEHGAFTTFELLQGETLGTLVARQPWTEAETRRFVRASLAAVGALHAAGWIHGDLNADNFLLHQNTTWKLLELPFYRGGVEEHPALYGSIYTLAPEQIDGSRPDARSDLFALGCLYYYAAAGAFPHAGGSEADIAVARLRFPATPLDERAPEFSRAFTAWIMRLLARHPADRPQDVSAACQLLELLGDTPS